MTAHALQLIRFERMIRVCYKALERAKTLKQKNRELEIIERLEKEFLELKNLNHGLRIENTMDNGGKSQVHTKYIS